MGDTREGQQLCPTCICYCPQLRGSGLTRCTTEPLGTPPCSCAPLGDPRGHSQPCSASALCQPSPSPEKNARPRVLMSLYCSFRFDYRKKKGEKPVYKLDVIQGGPGPRWALPAVL